MSFWSSYGYIKVHYENVFWKVETGNDVIRRNLKEQKASQELVKDKYSEVI